MKKILCTTAIVLGLLVSSPLMAVQEPHSDGPTRSTTEKVTPETASPGRFDQPLIRSADFIGNTVRGSEGNEVGKVSQLLFDAESGQVRYLVVSTAGTEGLAEGEYLVPWQAVNSDPEGKTVALDIPVDRFKDAPAGIAIGSEEKAEELHRFYGVAPFWEESAPGEIGSEGEKEPLLHHDE